MRVIYWISTAIVSGLMAYSFYAYFNFPELKAAFVHLGFPDYFRVELGIAKLLGAIALILPFTPARLKEWAYFGFFVNFTSACIAHIASGDPANEIGLPIILLMFLAASYLTWHQTRQ